jgi:DNA mismatch repair protein MutS2
VVVTTHYEGLKALALGDDRFQNASVGFDFTTMTPTFRVAIGIPGRSSALAVARRYGMPGTVIERAEKFLSTEEVAFEALVEKLQRERAAVDMARAALEEKLAAADREREELRHAIDEARARDRAALERELDEFRQRLRAAKEELRRGRERAKQKGPEAQRDAEAILDDLAHDVAIGGRLERVPERERASDHAGFDPSKLQRGARVHASRLRADVEVIDVLPNGQVRVAAGAIKLLVDPRELGPARSTREESSEAPKQGKHGKGAKGVGASSRAALPSASPGRVYVRTAESTCDLRGMRTDDALVFAASFVDRVMHRGDDAAFLLHGHGTGALKEALRRELAGAKHVRLVRPGEPDEGGDAFTVVVLH